MILYIYIKFFFFFVYRYVLLYRYERRGIIQQQAGVCSCASIYNLYILYVYRERTSVIVCIITTNVPPTSEEYLSVVKWREAPNGRFLHGLLCGAVSVGKVGSSL